MTPEIAEFLDRYYNDWPVAEVAKGYLKYRRRQNAKNSQAFDIVQSKYLSISTC